MFRFVFVSCVVFPSCLLTAQNSVAQPTRLPRELSSIEWEVIKDTPAYLKYVPGKHFMAKKSTVVRPEFEWTDRHGDVYYWVTLRVEPNSWSKQRYWIARKMLKKTTPKNQHASANQNEDRGNSKATPESLIRIPKGTLPLRVYTLDDEVEFVNAKTKEKQVFYPRQMIKIVDLTDQEFVYVCSPVRDGQLLVNWTAEVTASMLSDIPDDKSPREGGAQTQEYAPRF